MNWITVFINNRPYETFPLTLYQTTNTNVLRHRISAKSQRPRKVLQAKSHFEELLSDQVSMSFKPSRLKHNTLRMPIHRHKLKIKILMLGLIRY